MSDGGMQWWAEVGQYEQEQREAEAQAMADALEAHRKWKAEFLKQPEASNAEHQ